MSAVTVAEAAPFVAADPVSDASMLQLFIDAAEETIANLIGSPVAPTVVTAEKVTSRILRNHHTVGDPVVTDAAGTVLSGYEILPGGLLSGPISTDLTVTYTAGFSPLPAGLRLAILYTVQHAWESQRGAVPVSFQSGADETFTTSRGFAVPNRAKEYLAPYLRAASVA